MRRVIDVNGPRVAETTLLRSGILWDLADCGFVSALRRRSLSVRSPDDMPARGEGRERGSRRHRQVNRSQISIASNVGTGDDWRVRDRPIDFLVTYAGTDRPWAEWIPWPREQAGCGTAVQVWDLRPGLNFVDEMHQATRAAAN